MDLKHLKPLEPKVKDYYFKPDTVHNIDMILDNVRKGEETILNLSVAADDLRIATVDLERIRFQNTLIKTSAEDTLRDYDNLTTQAIKQKTMATAEAFNIFTESYDSTIIPVKVRHTEASLREIKLGLEDMAKATTKTIQTLILQFIESLKEAWSNIKSYFTHSKKQLEILHDELQSKTLDISRLEVATVSKVLSNLITVSLYSVFNQANQKLQCTEPDTLENEVYALGKKLHNHISSFVQLSKDKPGVLFTETMKAVTGVHQDIDNSKLNQIFQSDGLKDYATIFAALAKASTTIQIMSRLSDIQSNVLFNTPTLKQEDLVLKTDKNASMPMIDFLRDPNREILDFTSPKVDHVSEIYNSLGESESVMKSGFQFLDVLFTTTETKQEEGKLRGHIHPQIARIYHQVKELKEYEEGLAKLYNRVAPDLEFLQENITPLKATFSNNTNVETTKGYNLLSTLSVNLDNITKTDTVFTPEQLLSNFSTIGTFVEPGKKLSDLLELILGTNKGILESDVHFEQGGYFINLGLLPNLEVAVLCISIHNNNQSFDTEIATISILDPNGLDHVFSPFNSEEILHILTPTTLQYAKDLRKAFDTLSNSVCSLINQAVMLAEEQKVNITRVEGLLKDVSKSFEHVKVEDTAEVAKDLNVRVLGQLIPTFLKQSVELPQSFISTTTDLAVNLAYLQANKEDVESFTAECEKMFKILGV